MIDVNTSDIDYLDVNAIQLIVLFDSAMIELSNSGNIFLLTISADLDLAKYLDVDDPYKQENIGHKYLN